MKATAYVDGSYSSQLEIYGSGVYMEFEDGRRCRIQQAGDAPDWKASHNIAGELIAAMLAASKAVSLGATELLIIHDNEGIAHWALGTWKRNKAITQFYYQHMKGLMDSGLKLGFEWVKGHSGNKGNTYADILAGRAITDGNLVEVK
jgi:ribonuclease HI